VNPDHHRRGRAEVEHGPYQFPQAGYQVEGGAQPEQHGRDGTAPRKRLHACCIRHADPDPDGRVLSPARGEHDVVVQAQQERAATGCRLEIGAPARELQCRGCARFVERLDEVVDRKATEPAFLQAPGE
jgi:hypothetical protein